MNQDGAREHEVTPEDAPIHARNSGWAMAGVFCSCAVCCPVLTLIGPLLGLRALVQINADPQRIAGRGMARAAIIMGLLFTTVQGSALWWWQVNARGPMLHGPQTEIVAGQRGDWNTVRKGFEGAAAVSVEDELQSFFKQVSNRYGRLVESHQKDLNKADIPALDAYAPRVFYTMQFDRQSIDADACFVLFEQTGVGVPAPVLRWRWLRIIDPVNGDLVYPECILQSPTPPPPIVASTKPAATQP